MHLHQFIRDFILLKELQDRMRNYAAYPPQWWCRLQQVCETKLNQVQGAKLRCCMSDHQTDSTADLTQPNVAAVSDVKAMYYLIKIHEPSRILRSCIDCNGCKNTKITYLLAEDFQFAHDHNQRRLVSPPFGCNEVYTNL
jgi:hypothetical protein